MQMQMDSNNNKSDQWIELSASKWHDTLYDLGCSADTVDHRTYYDAYTGHEVTEYALEGCVVGKFYRNSWGAGKYYIPKDVKETLERRKVEQERRKKLKEFNSKRRARMLKLNRIKYQTPTTLGIKTKTIRWRHNEQ